ncbi:hypothetical protein BYT27DRAFT_7185460 [Phlegmacium glaucopus]|nr:hypothetical protein BYT27DRAFT_7185460 [Phlegmacium glaucopus]
MGVARYVRALSSVKVGLTFTDLGPGKRRKYLLHFLRLETTNNLQTSLLPLVESLDKNKVYTIQKG